MVKKAAKSQKIVNDETHKLVLSVLQEALRAAWFRTCRDGVRLGLGQPVVEISNGVSDKDHLLAHYRELVSLEGAYRHLGGRSRKYTVATVTGEFTDEVKAIVTENCANR